MFNEYIFAESFKGCPDCQAEIGGYTMISFTGISKKQFDYAECFDQTERRHKTAEGITHKGTNRLNALSLAALRIFTKVFDKLLACGTLFATSPLFLLIALAIKLNSFEIILL